MEVPRHILDDIAGDMEIGYKCFIHRDTHEVVVYLDPYEDLDVDPLDWQEQISKVKKNKKKFIEIDKMDSRQSFEVMVEFVESLEDSTTKIKLITALEGKKPFANFKHQIHNAGQYRDLWFAFLREKNIEWIQKQLR